MNNTTVLDIAKIAAPIIGSRDVAHNLRKSIMRSRSYNILLDFKSVDFISRSAAHELLSLKEILRHNFLFKKEIVFVNVNESVTQMLKAVATSRILPKTQEELHIKKIEVDSLFSPSLP